MYRNEEKILMKKLLLKLIDLRHQNNLTQEKFGELIGFQREYIAKVETGKRNMTLKYLLRALIVFNIEPDVFIKNLF